MTENQNLFNDFEAISLCLMRNDLRWMYTILENFDKINSNYVPFSSPFYATLIDGVEEWIKAYNRSHECQIPLVTFDDDQKLYYDQIRGSIKLWNEPYLEAKELLHQKYRESEEYFFRKRTFFEKILNRNNVFGADIVDGEFCGNTILVCLYLPRYKIGEYNGETIKKYAEIGGNYISFFKAEECYPLRKMEFRTVDYGCLLDSPFGNEFNDQFVLFSLLCQINFVLICIEKFIAEECSTKLRFLYLQYFYTLKILPDINENLKTHFHMDGKWNNDLFRNAMAHYKVGVVLRKKEEIIRTDPFFGIVQKYFSCDYGTVKAGVIQELESIAEQLKIYLHLK